METNPSIPAPLPVIRVIYTAIYFVWSKRARLLRSLFIPAIAIFALEKFVFLYNRMLTEPSFWGSMLGSWFYVAIQSLPYILFAITCHRLVILGDDGVPHFGLFKWTKRESWYLGWFLVISIICMLLAFAINSYFVLKLVNSVEAGASVESVQSKWRLIYLVYVPILYVFCRLSVLYPAIAVDREVTAHWAWGLSRQNGWRLTLIVGFLPWGVSFLMQYLFRENATFAEYMLLKLLGLMLLAVEIVALSFSYKHLTITEA